MSWKSEDAAAGEWFMEKGINEREFETMHEAKKSPKLIMLAHIVTLASRNGDKTLVYSKDLKTLDIVEWFLRQRNWKVHVDSLSQFKDQLGGWKKGQDFVRIDGSVDSGRRGDLVDEFGATEKIKVFLISSLAGGIGINLVRIFPMDLFVCMKIRETLQLIFPLFI
jgi:SNF2 family DNA or RNA helicase